MVYDASQNAPHMQRFQKFLNLKSEDPIAPIAQKILDEFVSQPNTLQGILQHARDSVARGASDPRASQQFNKGSRVSHIEDIMFLAAIGAQLAFEETQRTPIAIKRFFVDLSIEDLRRRYAHRDSTHATYPNSICIATPWLIAFSGRAFTAAQLQANVALHKVFEDTVYSSIESSAEEAYHAYQLNDPEAFAKLEPRLKARYGEDWRSARSNELGEILCSRNSIRMEEFRKNDPIEMDADILKANLSQRINLLVGRYLSNQVQIS